MIFHHDLHLMVFHPKGKLTEKRIERDIVYLEEAEDRSKHPFNRFTDTTDADLSELTFNQILRISLHRRLRYNNRPRVKSAFYFNSDEAERIIKIHALMTGHSPIQVRLFQEIEAAAKWLGVSVADLQMGKERAVPSSVD
jgi:hypothetical protein